MQHIAYVSQTILRLIIKISVFYMRKLSEKMAAIRMSTRSTSALKIIVLMLLRAVVPRK